MRPQIEFTDGVGIFNVSDIATKNNCTVRGVLSIYHTSSASSYVVNSCGIKDPIITINMKKISDGTGINGTTYIVIALICN